MEDGGIEVVYVRWDMRDESSTCPTGLPLGHRLDQLPAAHAVDTLDGFVHLLRLTRGQQVAEKISLLLVKQISPCILPLQQVLRNFRHAAFVAIRLVDVPVDTPDALDFLHVAWIAQHRADLEELKIGGDHWHPVLVVVQDRLGGVVPWGGVP